MSEIDPSLYHQAVLPAFIELFDIIIPEEIANLEEGLNQTEFYYTPMTKMNPEGEEQYITFDSRLYVAFPIKISGLERTTSGAPPRAELHFANIVAPRLFGALAFLFGDIIGATVIYRRTFEPYLASGLEAPPMKFTIVRKVTHNRTGVSFELKTPLDDDRNWLPGRQMLQRDFPGLGINKRYS